MTRGERGEQDIGIDRPVQARAEQRSGHTGQAEPQAGGHPNASGVPVTDHAPEGGDADDDERRRDRFFGPETDDIDESGHGQDRTAPAEGAERKPDEKPQGQGEEEPHTTVPGRASVAATGSPAAAQACIPPPRFTASKPERTRRAVAVAERLPDGR